uniref:Uncharacterized protein n=1 Tax=Rhizophora mucronata TaxID=61149 RepID=A0A2P2NFR6_RHIMU
MFSSTRVIFSERIQFHRSLLSSSVQYGIVWYILWLGGIARGGNFPKNLVAGHHFLLFIFQLMLQYWELSFIP